MKLHLWGTDFRRSTPELRARLFISPETRKQKLEELIALGFNDLVYLNTCNRIELYTTASDYFSDTRAAWVKALKTFGLDEEDFYRGYHLEGKSALRHLMRVASSLESMVIGEPQILGQLKEALRFTKENGLPLDGSLERAFHLAFEAAKSVRAETSIAEKPVSVASLGLKHLQARESDFPVTRVAVVGRSPISLIAIQWFLKNRPGCPIVWANRNQQALDAFPESRASGVTVMSLTDFLASPPDISHLFTATSSPEPIFREEFFRRLGGGRKLVFDFAQPPDVERGPSTLEYAELVHLENLKVEAQENSAARAQAVAKAERIIDESLRNHCLEQKEAPLIREFSELEPKVMEELALALASIEKDIPESMRPRLRKGVEKLVKRNLHHSREHLRDILRKVTEPHESYRIVG